MILYSNGCSWTAGGGLERYFGLENSTCKTIDDEAMLKSHTWAAHLGKKLGVEAVINHGRGCGSNPRILRTTFDFLSTASYNPDELIIGIQLTEPTRFEYYIPNQDDFETEFTNAQKSWRQVKVDINETPWGRDDKEIMFTNRFLERYSSELQNQYQLLFQIGSLHSMFVHHGIKNYFFWTFALQNFIPSIKKYLESFPFYILETKVDATPCNHPNLKGHEQIANILYDKFFANKTLRKAHNVI